MEKKVYEAPSIEVIEFFMEDAISASTTGAWYNNFNWNDPFGTGSGD